MKLVEVLSRRPDPWYGDNIVAIHQDSDGQYWKIHYNDVGGIDSPWSWKEKVKPIEVTATKWVKE